MNLNDLRNLTPEERQAVWKATGRYTAPVQPAPRCRCGGRMEFTGRHSQSVIARHDAWRYEGGVEVWRCTRRRWWNWWKHPFEYMLPERR